jgi:hypothetical protein
VADLRARGLEFKTFDLDDLEVVAQIVVVPNNYPSKGTGERGAFFFDSEGNLLGIGQATRWRQPRGVTTPAPGSGFVPAQAVAVRAVRPSKPRSASVEHGRTD